MTKIFYSPRIKEIIDFMAVYYDLTIRDEQTSRLDELANLYNKTKDKKYSKEWYVLVEKITKQLNS
jgi:hypothetical protein